MIAAEKLRDVAEANLAGGKAWAVEALAEAHRDKERLREDAGEAINAIRVRAARS